MSVVLADCNSAGRRPALRERQVRPGAVVVVGGDRNDHEIVVLAQEVPKSRAGTGIHRHADRVQKLVVLCLAQWRIPRFLERTFAGKLCRDVQPIAKIRAISRFSGQGFVYQAVAPRSTARITGARREFAAALRISKLLRAAHAGEKTVIALTNSGAMSRDGRMCGANGPAIEPIVSRRDEWRPIGSI